MVAKSLKNQKNRWNKRKTTTTYSYKRKSISLDVDAFLERVESVTVYRLYDSPTMEHFYTTSAYERRALIDKYGWVDEGIAWKSPKAPTTDGEENPSAQQLLIE